MPEPLAVALEEVGLNIEFTEYSTVIATIEGCTFWATPTAVSEYPCKEINWVFKFTEELLLLSSEVVAELLVVINCLTIASLIGGTLTQVPITIAVPNTPQQNGNTTVLPKPAPPDFFFLPSYWKAL